MSSGFQKGLTQNANESINNIVWSRCPKRLFCGRERYMISVCEAITQFNNGANGRKQLFKDLNLDICLNAFTGLQKQDKIRLQHAAYKISEKYKHRRQKLRVLRKNKSKKAKKDYISDAFTANTVPDRNFIHEKVVEITFVHDQDVPFYGSN